MNQIDAIDVVSLLLGFAIVVGLSRMLGRDYRRGSSDNAELMVVVGSSLLLGYLISELMQFLRVLR